MNFTVCNEPQRAPEWFQSRLGRVTGSKAGVIYMGESTAGREDYAMQLALERMTGIYEAEGFISADMRRGIEKEPKAKMALQIRDGVLIRQTGFLKHNSLPIGISLDGDSGNFSCTYEFKCPKSKTHLKYLEEKKIPKIYLPQVMHGLYITEAKEAIFVSYDDRMPEGLDLFTCEVKAQDLPLAEYENALFKFLKEVTAMEAKLRLMQRGIL